MISLTYKLTISVNNSIGEFLGNKRGRQHGIVEAHSRQTGKDGFEDIRVISPLKESIGVPGGLQLKRSNHVKRAALIVRRSASSPQVVCRPTAIDRRQGRVA